MIGDVVGMLLAAGLLAGAAAVVRRYGLDTFPALVRGMRHLIRFTEYGMKALTGDREGKIRWLLLIAGRPQSQAERYLWWQTHPPEDDAAPPKDSYGRYLPDRRPPPSEAKPWPTEARGMKRLLDQQIAYLDNITNGFEYDARERRFEVPTDTYRKYEDALADAKEMKRRLAVMERFVQARPALVIGDCATITPTYGPEPCFECEQIEVHTNQSMEPVRRITSYPCEAHREVERARLQPGGII